MKIKVKIPETTREGEEVAPLEAIVEADEVVAYLPPCGGDRWPAIILRGGRSLSVLEPPETFFSGTAGGGEPSAQDWRRRVRVKHQELLAVEAKNRRCERRIEALTERILQLEDEIARLSDPEGWARQVQAEKRRVAVGKHPITPRS